VGESVLAETRRGKKVGGGITCVKRRAGRGTKNDQRVMKKEENNNERGEKNDGEGKKRQPLEIKKKNERGAETETGVLIPKVGGEDH